MENRSDRFMHTDSDGDELLITARENGWALVMARDTELGGVAEVIVRRDDAPRVAAELLRAAGWNVTPVFGTEDRLMVSEAISRLMVAADDIEAKALAKIEQEARLDSEALAMYNVFAGEDLDHPWPAHYNPYDKKRWIEVVKKARDTYRGTE